MAIVNPKNLYSGNAGIFNSTPYTNFAINQLAQKQAKDEAVDKYFGEQLAKTNSAGLADDEVKAMVIQKENAQKFYNQNKDAIHNVSKDNGQAYGQMQQNINKLNEIMGRGKAKVQDSKELYPLLANPEKSSLLTEDVGNNITAAHAPIYVQDKNGQLQDNPAYKNFDFGQHLYNEKPYSASEMDKISQQSNKNNKPDDIDYKPLTLADGTQSSTQIVGTPKYSQAKQLTAIQNDRNLANTDPRLLTTVANGHPFAQWKQDHEDDFNTINTPFKAVTGKDIADNADLYAAMEHLKRISPQQSTKPFINQDAKTANAQIFATGKMYTQDALIRGRMKTALGYKEAASDYNRTQNSGEQDGILNKFIDNTYNSGTNRLAGTNVDHITVDGQNYNGKMITLPASVQKEFASYDAQGNGKLPDAAYLTNDKKTIIPVFLKKDNKQNPITTSTGGNVIDPTSTKALPVQNLKVALSKVLLTKKQTGGEVTDDGSDAENEYGLPKNSLSTPTIQNKTIKPSTKSVDPNPLKLNLRLK